MPPCPSTAFPGGVRCDTGPYDVIYERDISKVIGFSRGRASIGRNLTTTFAVERDLMRSLSVYQRGREGVDDSERGSLCGTGRRDRSGPATRT